MACPACIVARRARPQGGRSRLWVWLVLPLGTPTGSGGGPGPRRIRKDAGAGKGLSADPAIAYQKADLEKLEIPAGFDLAYSSLAFHYIENLSGLLENIRRALVPGASLIFSIEHPIYTASKQPGWMTAVDGRKTWPIDSYQQEGTRVTNWLANGVMKQHRTMGTLLNRLIRAGFIIAHVEEWGPTNEQVAANPELAEERERPMILLVSAHRS